jgi:MFS family permease
MDEDTQAKPWSMARVVTASSAGTAFEWYDFFIFGSLTPVIAKVFLAGLDPTSALIAALALFAVGFAFRPLGAIIFGAMGDRVGRKATFLATVGLMGGATFAIGLLPSYATAGSLPQSCLSSFASVRAPRLAENMAARRSTSPNMLPTTSAVPRRLDPVVASFGLLAALLVIVATRTAVGEEAFADWGWRIPFLASVFLLGFRCGCGSSFPRVRNSPNYARRGMFRARR